MQILIYGTISGQNIKIADTVTAAETNNTLTAKFTFSKEWDKLKKIAYFRKPGEESFPFILEKDCIPARAGLNLTEGEWEISIRGYDLKSNSGTENTAPRLTTNITMLHVWDTVSPGDNEFPEVPKSLAEQILATAEDAKETAEDIERRANAGEFDGISVTITSISQSSESGGTSVIDFSDGNTLSIKNGKDGADYDHSEEYARLAAEMAEYAEAVATDRAAIGQSVTEAAQSVESAARSAELAEQSAESAKSDANNADDAAKAAAEAAETAETANAAAQTAAGEAQTAAGEAQTAKTAAETAATNAQAAADSVPELVADVKTEQRRLSSQLDTTDRALNALWKLNEGQTFDFEQVEESGRNTSPSGAEFMSVEEIRGKTEQITPDNPQEIHSVEEIRIKHTDAAGENIDEHIITLSEPLRAIRDKHDTISVDGLSARFIRSRRVRGFTWTRVAPNRFRANLSGYLTTTSDKAQPYIICDKYRTSVWANLTNNYISFYKGLLDVIDTSCADVAQMLSSSGDAEILLCRVTPGALDISDNDLSYLRNLATIPATDYIVIVDQDGNDIPWLNEYIINLRRVQS